MKRHSKRLLSILMALTLLTGVFTPAFSAADIITHVVDIYADGAPVTARITLMEGDTLQLTPTLIDCSMPTGGSFYWESETPILASVDQAGLLRAHDSSKGAVLRLWIDNDIRTIPVVGGGLATAIEKLFDGLDVDAMDGEGILNIVQSGASILPGDLVDGLIDKLRDRLNSLDTGIRVTVFDADGNVRATDEVRVLVTKSTAITADFFPNGTTITNKSQVPSTVEVGYTFPLQGVTTPMRLHMGVNWTIKKGKEFATLSDTGLATFTAPGEVTLMASPDVQGFMDNVLKYADLVGDDPETIAGTVANLLGKLGIPISTTIMKYALWGLLALVGTGNVVQWSSGAISTVANYLLQLGTNDTVTVKIVQNLPVTSFTIAGNTTVQEGSTQQLAVTNLVPKGATDQGIEWTVANTDYAGIGKSNGLLIGRDAGSSGGTRATTVTAVLDGVSMSKGVTVTGKNSTAVTEIEITGPRVALIGVMTQMTVKTYPARLIPAITWGILADDGTTEVFASATVAAENSLARINKNGILTPLEGGSVTVIAKTSETVKTYYKIFVGTLVTGLAIQQSPNVAVNVPLSQNYKNASTQLTPVFSPVDATNKKVLWSSSTGDISVDANGVCTPTKNSACWAVITATSQDGGFKATCVVSFANYSVTGISLDKSSVNLNEGGTSKLTETITPAGFLSMGAASIKSVIWTSSNPAVATVSGGTVTAVSPGDAVITATTVDAFKTATCSVSVRANKTALNEMINLVAQANLNPDDYLAEDFDAFIQVLEEALTVQSTELATQAQCDEATQLLALYFNALNQYTSLQGITLTFDGTPAPDYKTMEVTVLQNYTNQSLTFSYVLAPADADYKSITWSSSKSGISVNQSGKCQPTANSSAWSVITVRAEDYLGNIYTDSISVAFVRNPVDGISLNTNTIGSALVHDTYQLTETVTPTGNFAGTGKASETAVQWVSNNPEAATVSGGLITCVGPGSAIITAYTRDGGFTATCSITVYINKQLLETALNTVNNANLDYLRYTPTSWNSLLVALETAQTVFDNPDAVQTQLDTATAGLNAAYTGLVPYIYANSATIWYNGSAAGDFVSKNVTLVQNFTNQSIELSARLSPLDSYFESVVWKSSSAAVSVDQNGVCKPTANKACYAFITVTVTTYYGRTLTDTVYVAFANDSATRVDMTPANITASVGNAPQQITYVVKSQGTLSTKDADLQTVLWSSDNPDAVPVTQNGTVSFLNAGAANIRATSVDGGIYGTCYVVVTGDKTALAEAIAYIEAQNVNPQDYEYNTSTAFTTAYSHAVAVFTGVAYTQQEIDAAAAALYSTFEALEPYIHMTGLTVLYNGSPAPSHIAIKVGLLQNYKNQSVQLSSVFSPVDAMYTSLVWSSNDGSISVDQSGKCNPSENKAGGALITLTATDHFGNKLTDSVFVAFSNYPVEGMTIDQTALTATIGNAPPVTINAAFTPTGALGARVKHAYWSSSDPTVASVAPDGDEKGIVTFVDAGQCVITATSYDGDFTKTCSITIYANKVALINAINAISGFVLDPEPYTPESWAVFEAALDNAIAVRDVVFAKQGDVNSAKDALLAAFDGLVMYINIQAVYPTVNGEITNGYVTIDVPLTSSYKNQNVQLGYALFPLDTTLGTIAWSSNSGSISVDQTGLCTPTANSACRAVITVTATDYEGNIRTGSINVCFANYPVTGVSVSPSTIPNAINGGTATLTTAVTPAGTLGVGAANFSDVTWSTGNPAIATVTAAGVVTFKSAGIVTITATTVDGGFTADCTVTVSANKAALLTALSNINNLVQTNYTPASWNAMLAVYSTSSAVYNNALATQAETNTAAANVTAAYAALVPYVYVTSATVSVAGVNQNGYVIVHVPTDGAYTVPSTTLGVLFNPNAMYASIVWSSSNPNVSVTTSGVVKATVNQPCFATLTATITDHFGNHYTAKAVVAFVKVAAASITVTPTNITAGINSGTVQLSATLTGENAQTPDYPGIVWKTSNPAVAAVDQNGLVTIGIGGLAYVTASTEIGELSATCTVSIAIDKTPLANIINTVMRANYNPLNYTAASYAALTAALTSARAVYANPTSDQTAVNQATALLTAANSGLVTRQRMTSIVITSGGSAAPDFISKKVELYQQYSNQDIQLGVTINPTAAEYQTLVWSSSNASITVDQTGKCVPSENKAGTSIITVTATDSFGIVFTDNTTVAFVNYQATGVSLDKTSLSFMYKGAPQTLTPTLTPAGVLGVGSASIKTVTWRSSNTDVATVNANGAVSPVRPGTAVITCYTDDGGKTATCAVTVTGAQLYAASGSPATVNRVTKFVYGVPEGSASIAQYFSTPYGELVYTPTPLGYGTGTRIDVMFEGQLVDSYYLVIFGDADGDGYANGGDASYAALAVSYMASLSALQTFALDLNGNGTVDSADVQKLENVGMFMATINQVHPY